MTVISITITASHEEIITDIPRFIAISTNIPASIFFTLDGSVPTTSSIVYVDPIELPTDKASIILSVFATDGTNTSPVITNIYEVRLGHNLRVPHSATNAPSDVPTNDLYPFGNSNLYHNQKYIGVAKAGFTTDNPELPQFPTGFDADGYEAGFTNVPLVGVPTKSIPIQFSSTNAEGEMGHGIGTLPPHTVAPVFAAPEQTVVGSQTFNPKAMVIYQDLTKPQDPGLPPFINRMSFTLEDVSHTRTGNQFFNTALDAPPVSGSFVRQFYNGTDNTINYYYFDNSNSRWIISKIPAPPPAINNYASSMVFSPSNSAGVVFQWVLYKANYLY